MIEAGLIMAWSLLACDTPMEIPFAEAESLQVSESQLVDAMYYFRDEGECMTADHESGEFESVGNMTIEQCIVTAAMYYSEDSVELPVEHLPTAAADFAFRWQPNGCVFSKYQSQH